MIVRTVSHYRLERRVGAGGMGEVYLARDLALGRPTALKLLPEGFAPELRLRLLEEAETSARLQHPGIATFYEAGESDGSAFIAMEYVAGETLRSRLKSGSLPLPQAVSITACLLEALGHAHACGILHRDIKPENIMITGERTAKLLDFGIAKRLTDEIDSQTLTMANLTRTGAIVGTLGYMSPEQLNGEPLDARSDLFSLGAVLYEAIVGRPAFPGRTPVEKITAILTKDPPPLAEAGVDPELSAIVARALARDPDQRIRSATAFLNALRQPGGGVAVAALPDTLAVIDLENLSGSHENDWIGSGIAESLAADLARVKGLSVVAREKVLKARSALERAEKRSDALELGLAIGSRWALSGSFQRMGSALRVTVRLTEVSTARVVSTEKIDGKVEGIFDIQDRLAAAIAEGLNLESPTPAPEPAAPPKLEAFEAYARGRRLWFRLEKGSFEQAGELYAQAVQADPNHAPALSGLAALHAMRFTFTTDPRDLQAAVRCARRAIQVDPQLSDPHVWLGYALWRQGKTEAAVAEEMKVIELDASNYWGPYFAACVLFVEGRRRETLSMFQRAVELGPQHGWGLLGLGWTHLELDQRSEARWSLEKAVELERRQDQAPTAGVSGFLGEALRRIGELSEARARCLQGLEAVERSDNMYRDTFRGVCLCALGRTALQQNDREAARAAFHQAASHLRGRRRTLGGGSLLVQSLAGLARAGEGAAPLEEAMRLFERRKGFDFSFFWTLTDDVTLLELARAATAVDRNDQARPLLDRARQAGSGEVLGVKGSSESGQLPVE